MIAQRILLTTRQVTVITTVVLLALVIAAAKAAAEESPTDAPGLRLMLKVQIPTEAGNKAIQDGTMNTILQELVAKIKPESAYFSQEDGYRTAYFVYVADPSIEFSAIHEPLIQGLDARVYYQPAVSWEELEADFKALSK